MIKSSDDSRPVLRFWLNGCLLLPFLLGARSLEAQVRFDALYELGTSTTDLGPDEGQSTFGYGFGLSGSYGLRRESTLGLVVGSDLLVRGFGLDVPGRLAEEVGVFQQADLLLDEYVAARFRRLSAGLYLEQRRIDRGIEAGSIGFPLSAVGFMGRASAAKDGRVELQFSYARAVSGRLRLRGVPEEPEVESGRSLRITGSYRFSRTFAVRGEYSDSKFTFDPESILGSFFDHRQKGIYLGLVLTLSSRPPDAGTDHGEARGGTEG
jgi:hypothetical protein